MCDELALHLRVLSHHCPILSHSFSRSRGVEGKFRCGMLVLMKIICGCLEPDRRHTYVCLLVVLLFALLKALKVEIKV